MRLLFQSLPDPQSGGIAKVFSKNEYGEYTVKFYDSKGTHMDASDAFTDDRDDAMAMATWHRDDTPNICHEVNMNYSIR